MSLSHLAVLAFGFSFLGAQICNCFFSYAVLEDQVFCLSNNGILFSIGINDNLFKLIVSLRLLDALSCVTCHAEYPQQYSVAKCLDSLLHVIRFTFVFRDIVLVCFFCLVKFQMLASLVSLLDSSSE